MNAVKKDWETRQQVASSRWVREFAMRCVSSRMSNAFELAVVIGAQAR